jgi:hypothetical protein
MLVDQMEISVKYSQNFAVLFINTFARKQLTGNVTKTLGCCDSAEDVRNKQYGNLSKARECTRFCKELRGENMQ